MRIGQTCPECGADTRVVDTRPYLDGVRRRRECKECGHRYSTLEYNIEYVERLREGVPTEEQQRKAEMYDELQGIFREFLDIGGSDA